MKNVIIEGTNPDFDSIDFIHSHRVEIYGALSVLLFINEYCKYYLLEQRSSIKYYCDNLELVNKISMLLENANTFQGKYKTTDHDVVLKIQTYLPNKLAIYHIKERQNTGKNKINLPARFNIKPDKLI